MNRIKELRERSGKQQKEMAIDLGVSQPTISCWENGSKSPSAKSAEKIASYFGTTVDYVLGRETQENEKDLESSIPMVEVQAFRRNLAFFRKRAGLSRREVASQLGITAQAYGNYENGIRTPDIFTAQRIAKIFNTTVDSLVNEEKARQGESPNGPETINLSAEVDNLTEAQKQAFALFLKELKEL